MKIHDIEITSSIDVDEVLENNGDTSLMKACAGGDYELLRDLLLERADQLARNKYGRTALMRAAGNGHLKCTRLLIDVARGERILRDLIFIKDGKGKTALDWARLAHHHDVAKAIENAMQGVLLTAREEDKERDVLEHAHPLGRLRDRAGELHEADDDGHEHDA